MKKTLFINNVDPHIYRTSSCLHTFIDKLLFFNFSLFLI